MPCFARLLQRARFGGGPRSKCSPVPKAGTVGHSHARSSSRRAAWIRLWQTRHSTPKARRTRLRASPGYALRRSRSHALGHDLCALSQRLKSTARARSTTWWHTKRLWTQVRASVRRLAQPSKPPPPQSRALQRRTSCRTCCCTARPAQARLRRSWRLLARSTAPRRAL